MKKESVNNLVGTNVLYGRARRIEFVERAAFIIVGIISVILVFVIVGKKNNTSEVNVNFSYLREYIEARGYICEVIYRSGGSCTAVSKAVTSSFIRYDDGFQFITKSDGYFLEITYMASKGDYIKLKTTPYALQGYVNKEYTCSYKDNILNEVEECKDKDGEKLDSATYIGVVNKAMYDLYNIIDNSGYRKDKLLDKHEWVKKISG